jgi:hypothetical protein
MARKIVLVLVLAALVAGGAFSQQKKTQTTEEPQEPDIRGALSLDLAPMFIGFIAGEKDDTTETSYFALSPAFELAVGNYSVGARLDLIFGSYGKDTKRSITHTGAALVGKWYPLARLQKVYVGTELGFNTCSLEDADDPLYTGLTFALRMGWKHIMGKVFLEPSLGYVLSKTDGRYPFTPSGWEIGLNFGFAF